MKTTTHGNGNGLDDLYILPDDQHEAERITRYLKERGQRFSWSASDVMGQDWYGKAFIEIAFGESLLPEIEAALKLKDYKAAFFGCNRGALGDCYPIVATTRGTDEESARLALYDRFDHISRLELTAI